MKTKGFSLLEILVASLIAVIGITGTTMIIYQNGEMSNNFYNRSNAYNKINFLSRIIELSIKEGASTIIEENGSVLKIYDFENVFTIGYKLKDKKIYYCDEDNNVLKLVSPILNDASFDEFNFQADNNKYVYFDLKLSLLKNEVVRYTTQSLRFYSKCRSLYSL
ncbi:MAG: prepilin-type N-terminal cleavage/methylation domain-containing protein [Candidatus Delongbacteria bacterium]|nr:prepilin-type N-terminal cleavage/methylation domain-containing protein [Candidatus Delongbacteria bacterium]MBN2834591.1 prepilin-type N-terminal cleavage/methylation domain-containing protein [Candidatus Delongbacteria bacterium]